MKEKKEKKFGTKKQIAAVNSITGLRFLASFLIIPIFKALGGAAAGTFAIIFSLTDWIDGFLARKFKSSTFFGSIFDGISDKAFCVTILALLMTINPVVFSIPLLIELGIIVAQGQKAKKGLNVKSNMIGKIKMWALSITSIASFFVMDLLNMPFFIEYVKTASLASVDSIKNFLIMLGINIPSFVFQLLTLKSYSDEYKDAKEEERKLMTIDLETLSKKEVEVLKSKLCEEDKKILEEYFNISNGDDDKEEVKKKSPETILNEIASQKEQLKEEYTFLEKAKIIKEKLFDPEYYLENKDRQIGVLTRELFDKKRNN